MICKLSYSYSPCVALCQHSPTYLGIHSQAISSMSFIKVLGLFVLSFLIYSSFLILLMVYKNLFTPRLKSHHALPHVFSDYPLKQIEPYFEPSLYSYIKDSIVSLLTTIISSTKHPQFRTVGDQLRPLAKALNSDLL